MNVRLKIPMKNGVTIEVEGDFNEIKESIEKLDEIIEPLPSAIGTLETSSDEPIKLGEEIDITETPEVPTISKKNKESTSKAILELLNSAWGRKGRTSKELQKALAENMVHKSDGAMSGTLSYLAKNNKLQRKEEEGTYKYYPAV